MHCKCTRRLQVGAPFKMQMYVANLFVHGLISPALYNVSMLFAELVLKRGGSNTKFYRRRAAMQC